MTVLRGLLSDSMPLEELKQLLVTQGASRVY